MQDAGGGGGGGTYWYGIDPDLMWAWVNRDLSPHYEQANAWKKASELTGLYQSRLQAFRDKLAQSWNPQTSPAAEAYLTKLDELIKAVKDVDEVTGRNYQAAVDIPNAIYEAKTKLEPIYNRIKQAERDYDAEGNDRSSAGDSPANRYNDAVIEAAGVMYTLSGDLSRSQTGIGKPAPYVPPQTNRANTDDGGDYGDVSPPVIPPVVPVVPASPPTMPSGPISQVSMPRAPDLQGLTPTLPTTGTPIGTPPGVGPINPPGGPALPGPLPPGGIIKAPAPAGLPPKIGMPPMPGVLGGVPPTGARAGVPGVIGVGPNAAGRPAGGARANPVGGMIGGPSSGRAGGSGVGHGPAAAGGVISGGRGQAGRGPGQGGAAAAGRGAMAMGVGGHGTGRQDEDGEHFDPDTQWDVAQGVAPVLDAPETQRPIDPGPAIGLGR